ncbi:hypothetical protein DESC_310020 [Desulfosarcina cetonica]|nr:hypothetical protein DESC_310020 [Desulfosarcina cetonica]
MTIELLNRTNRPMACWLIWGLSWIANSRASLRSALLGEKKEELNKVIMTFSVLGNNTVHSLNEQLALANHPVNNDMLPYCTLRGRPPPCYAFGTFIVAVHWKKSTNLASCRMLTQYLCRDQNKCFCFTTNALRKTANQDIILK